MFLVSSCSCLLPTQWSQVLSWEWRCSWSSADRRCSNYIWVIDNFIAYWGASYIRDLTVYLYYIYVISSINDWQKLHTENPLSMRMPCGSFFMLGRNTCMICCGENGLSLCHISNDYFFCKYTFTILHTIFFHTCQFETELVFGRFA